MQELLRSNTQVSTLFREVNIRDVAINSPRGILYTTSRNRISLFNLSTGEGRMINAGMNGLEDGALTDAMFSAPEGLDIIPGQWQNGHDTLVIADTKNNMIRVIDMARQQVTSVAGQGTVSSDMYDGLGTNATFSHPSGLRLTNRRDVYVADKGNNRIRKIALLAYAEVTSVVGTGISGVEDGTLSSARLGSPNGLAIDISSGETTPVIYITTTVGGRIRKADFVSGMVTTVIGLNPYNWICIDGPTNVATVGVPRGIEIDSHNGIIYFSDLVCDTRNMRHADTCPLPLQSNFPYLIKQPCSVCAYGSLRRPRDSDCVHNCRECWVFKCC
jgi:hypothetical protein